jgi:tetratricopeptide (TPR) repeat protein
MAERLLVLCFASLLQAQPQLPSLEPLFRQAVAEREKSLGPDHPKVAASLVDLAKFLQRNGDAAAAEPLLVRARKIYEGGDSIALAAVLAELAEISGDRARTQQLLRASLEAHATFEVAARLADLRESDGDLKDAEALYQRAMELAGTPARTAAAANNLGLVLEGQGRRGEAEAMFARAAALYEKVYGRNHPEFATALMNLAGTVRARGELTTAIGMLRNAVSILQSTVGAAHAHTQAACRGLNDALVESGAPVQRGCNLSDPKTPIQ